MPALAGHLDDACADLGRSDQGAVGDGRGESHAPGLKQGDEVHRDHGHHRAAERQHPCHEEEGATLPTIEPDDGARAFGSRDRMCGGPGDRDQDERQRDREVQPGIGEAGPAPADLLDQEGRERPADRAGEAAPQGQRRDGGPCLGPVEASEGGEGGIVQAGAHAEADEEPACRGKTGRFGARPRIAGRAARATAAKARTGRPPCSPM